jgi:pimeloyl-ACP methyl ester carboxylesterase
MKSNSWFDLVRFVRFASMVPMFALASSAVPAQGASETAHGGTSAVLTVRSKDGTSIAFEKTGKGPPLILVAPALGTRADGARLAALLAPSFTVVNFDRRGRGDSGDARAYAVEREIEDIAALIEHCGGSASLFGSSSGAVLALEAANALGAKVTAQVLFEPPFIVDSSRPAIAADFPKRIANLLAEDRRGEAVSAFMVEAVGVPEAMVRMMRKTPMWAKMEKVAHTLPYDLAIMAGLHSGKDLPANRWTSVTARTLVIDGERSDAYLRTAVQKLTAALPGAMRQTLEGQDHSAVFMAPQTLVPILVEFLVSGAARSGGASQEKASRSPATRKEGDRVVAR